MSTFASDVTSVRRLASLLSCAAVASAVLAFVVTEIAPTGLSPVRTAVSEWALTPYEWGYRWFTMSLTVAALALLVAVLAAVGRRGIPVAIALGFVAFGRSFVGWVPMDAPGVMATATGRTHFALGAVSFVSFVAATFLVRRAVRGEQADGLRRFSLVTGVLAAVLLVGIVVAPTSIFGLVERAFYLCLVSWLAVFAISSVRATRVQSA